MRNRGMLAILLATISLSGSAAALEVGSFQKGNDLWEACRSRMATGYFTDRCSMYVMGVIDGLSVPKGQGLIDLPFCLHRGVIGQQLAEVVVKYLDQNPARRDLPAAMLVTDALATAFPCPPPGQQ